MRRNCQRASNARCQGNLVGVFFCMIAVSGLFIVLTTAHSAIAKQPDVVLVDPTRPLIKAPRAQANEDEDLSDTDLNVNAIFFSEHSRKAIINGKTVYEGDNVRGMTLIAIRPSGVTLKHAQHTLTLYTNNNNVAKHVSSKF
ncbi:general secretion pathway protein GspB [Aestuariibacter sp. AA17]|uniref:General secretion pathway protein GspB n=1 Tax=Fluctibacter corallii TaxID=2984329 RepID=A0ABT3AAZ5_9ALTE|nr:general secretion pathway protein GspB [Aestuariibacter sp. AA17]MCV2885789.1 general secretion pathway protein GspB [Aestuariibacter sp. AA17]